MAAISVSHDSNQFTSQNWGLGQRWDRCRLTTDRPRQPIFRIAQRAGPPAISARILLSTSWSYRAVPSYTLIGGAAAADWPLLTARAAARADVAHRSGTRSGKSATLPRGSANWVLDRRAQHALDYRWGAGARDRGGTFPSWPLATRPLARCKKAIPLTKNCAMSSRGKIFFPM